MSGLSPAVAFGVLTFVATITGVLAGYRMSRWRGQRRLSVESIGTVRAIVFPLVGLLLAFAFSAGTSRLDARRQLVIREANAISTAYLRLDVLDPPSQPPLRRLFREFLGARMRVYDSRLDFGTAEREYRRAQEVQQRIWTTATGACQLGSSGQGCLLLLPAITDMIDVVTSRSIQSTTHLPGLVIALLMSVTLLSGCLAGYAMGAANERDGFLSILLALAMSITIFVVIDLDYPRQGFITVGLADEALVELQKSIGK